MIIGNKAFSHPRLCAVLVPLLCAVLLCSCSLPNKKPEKLQFYAMETVIEITAYNGTGKALEAAKEKIEYYDTLFSPEKDGSEIFRINSRSGSATDVSEETAALISTALDIGKKSGGALDIAVYPLVKEWGFISKAYSVPSRDRVDDLLALTGSGAVSVSDNTVTLRSGTEISLGCIAKGYAAQKAAEALRENGVSGAIISLGGNIQTIGEKPGGEKWKIAIVDPVNPDGSIGTVCVGDTAVVTSGAYQQNFTENGVFYHHILDPSTGYPSDSGVTSVTIVCPDGAMADGLSTACFVMGIEKSLEYQALYGGFEAIFVNDNKEVFVTDGLADSFSLNESGGYCYGK